MINPPRHPELFEAAQCEHCTNAAEYAVRTDRTFCVCQDCLTALTEATA